MPEKYDSGPDDQYELFAGRPGDPKPRLTSSKDYAKARRQAPWKLRVRVYWATNRSKHSGVLCCEGPGCLHNELLHPKMKFHVHHWDRSHPLGQEPDGALGLLCTPCHMRVEDIDGWQEYQPPELDWGPTGTEG